MVELIFVSLSAAIGVALEFIVDLLASVFGFDFFFFANTFPYAADAFIIFQRIAVGLILLISAAQILFFFIGKENNRPSPLRIAMYAFLAVGGVFYGNYILEGIMNIAQLPYDALLNTDITITIDLSAITWFLNEYFLDIPPLAYIALLLLISFSFIKLLLEAVERYVVLFCLVYLSPLASATLAAEATNGIFKRYFTMFLSQCLLLILNVWSLQMTVSMFQNLPTADGPVINLLIGYAFLRFACRIDSYLNSLGLNAAVTGAGLGAELMASGMAIMAGASNMMGGKGFSMVGNGAGNAGGNNILGKTASSISQIAQKYSPAKGARTATLNSLGAIGKTAGESLGAVGDAIKNTSGMSTAERIGAGIDAGKDTWQKNWKTNLRDANQATANSNLIFRGLGGNLDGYNPSMSLSSEVLNDVSNSGYLSDSMFKTAESSSSGISDVNTVSAMASGIGAGNLSPEMQEAINVGNGVVPAEGINYHADANGLHMEYEKDGKFQSMDIKNASQFSQLSPEEQKMYNSFHGADGTKYFYRQSTGRALTDTQKRQAETKSELNAFAANPASKLSPDSVAAMRRDPSHISSVFATMRSNGTSFTGETQEGKQAIAQAIATTPLNGKYSAQANEAIARVKRGDFTSAHMDGDGIDVSWKNSDGSESKFSVIAPGAEIAPNTISDDYSAHAMSNGDISYVSFTDGSSPAAREAAIMDRAANFGADNGMTTIDYGYAQNLSAAKKNDIINRTFDGLQQSGRTVTIGKNTSADQRKASADLINLPSFNGISKAQQSQISSAIAAGEANVVYTERGIYAESEDGVFQALRADQVISHNGKSESTDGKKMFDANELNGAGYHRTNLNGQEYWVRYAHPNDPSPIRKEV